MSPLALSILDSFKETTLYEHYKNVEGFTDAEYQAMLDFLEKIKDSPPSVIIAAPELLDICQIAFRAIGKSRRCAEETLGIEGRYLFDRLTEVFNNLNANRKEE